MKAFFIGATALIFAALASSHGANQSGVDRTGGFGVSSPFQRLYDLNSVITFTGKVISVTVAAPSAGMESAERLLIRSPNGGTSQVMVGPNWYLTHQGVRYEVGDTLQITGSKVFRNGKSFILAAKIVGAGDVLTLRDPDGYPVWDWYRHQPPSGAAKLEAIPGTVVAVEQDEAGMKNLKVDTKFGSVTLQTGPQWYWNRQNYTFDVGSGVTFYAGKPLQFGKGLVVTTDLLRIDSGYIVIENGNAPVWRSWAPK